MLVEAIIKYSNSNSPVSALRPTLVSLLVIHSPLPFPLATNSYGFEYISSEARRSFVVWRRTQDSNLNFNCEHHKESFLLQCSR
jgi:hypothetical protein